MSNLPTIQELYKSKELASKQDKLIALLNQNPHPSWIKRHPYIKGYDYIPIARLEWLARTIFKSFRFEILESAQSFNGVRVTSRFHYQNPVTNEWDFHDGIGAVELQLRAQTKDEKDNRQKVVFDVQNINTGAIGMAYPIADTRARKHAMSKLGKLFGADLNRDEEITYAVDLTLQEMNADHPNWQKVCEAIKSGAYKIEDIESKYDVSDESKAYLETLKPEEDESI